MDRRLEPCVVGPTGPAVAARVSDALRRALDGSGPAVAPTAGHDAGLDTGLDTGPGPAQVPEDVVLAVATSGSTGRPRRVLLDRSALVASAAATHDRLGGPGRWVLALPLAHVAGLQVLVRSLVAGTSPVVVPADAGLAGLARGVEQAVDTAGSTPVYLSLVPTQLHRVLAAADGATLPPALAPMRRLGAVLVGGAAAAPALLGRARELGLPVVTTYGMTETCGGCVYDGVPLDGVRVRVAGGVVHLAGPVLARGYLAGDWAAEPDPADLASTFVTADGVRWFRTGDLGEWTAGRLRVTGRRDDVLVTGGHKVQPAAVEAVLAAVPGVAEVSVVGVPDPEWGDAVTAVVVAGLDGEPDLAGVRAAVGRTLGPAAAPRHLVLVDRLPERGPGKVDRPAVARLAAVAVVRPVETSPTDGPPPATP